MFTQEFINALADAIAARISQKIPLTPVLPAQTERWPEVMSVPTVAKYIDRSEEAVYQLMKRGQLPVSKWIDSRPQVLKSDLDLLIRAGSCLNG
jgi:hypothetical protein